MTTTPAPRGSPSEFDRDIALVPDGDDFVGTMADTWRVGGGINGGFQLSMVGNAIRAALPKHPDPVAISAYYISPAVAGPVRAVVRPQRVGGRTATVAAELRQGEPGEEQVRLTVLATYGDLDAFPGDDVRTTAEPVRLPPRDQCVPNTMAPDEVKQMAPFTQRFAMLFHPDEVGWAVGQPSGRGQISAWFRLADDREPDPLSLLMAVDALPPVTFDLGLPGWAPTVELSAHVRAKPAPGWLRLRHRTRNSPAGCSRRTARSGTPRTGWSPSRASSPCCLRPADPRCTRRNGRDLREITTLLPGTTTQ